MNTDINTGVVNLFSMDQRSKILSGIPMPLYSTPFDTTTNI